MASIWEAETGFPQAAWLAWLRRSVIQEDTYYQALACTGALAPIHMNINTHASIPYTCAYKSKTLKTKRKCGRSCSALGGGYGTSPGILLGEIKDIWGWRRPCDDRPSGCGDEMWSLALRRERGTAGQGMWADFRSWKGQEPHLSQSPWEEGGWILCQLDSSPVGCIVVWLLTLTVMRNKLVLF